MEILIGILIGILLGGGAFLALTRARRKSEDDLKNTFAALSQQALQANADHVVRLAREVLSTQTESAKKDLEGEKKLIDQNLDVMTQRLAELQNLVQRVDKDREGSAKALATQLESTVQETLRLRQTAEQLNHVLSSPQHRGQWGERMAEDILRLAGFIENVNYFKQQQITGGAAASRPDFTFPLPNNLKLNMDVKFPLDNYLRYLKAASGDERERLGRAFIADVKNRIREAASRDYINPNDNTVDYALVFIPNEQVYGSIHEIAPTVLDESLRQKIVLCSPLTLYAVLAVIRQAAENVRMEHRAIEMAGLINAFSKQWGAFKEELDKLGSQLDTATKTHERLATTRIRQLEKPLDQIEQLRTQSQADALPTPQEPGG